METTLCSIIFYSDEKQVDTRFFISKTLISNARVILAKNQADTKQHPEAELLLFENYSLFSSTLSSKNNRRYSEKCVKNKYVYLNEVIWLMRIKMRLKMKIRSPRYDLGQDMDKNILNIKCVSV